MDYNNEKIYAKDGLQGLIDKDLVWRGREGG